MTYEGPPLVSLDGDGIHVMASEIAEKLEKKNLSPSTVTSMEGCGARWIADQFVTRALVPEEPDNAARRGSLFHKVMENLFAYPAEERTKQLMKKMVTFTLESDEFKDLASNKDVILWLRGAVNGYYNMGGDPTRVSIATLNKNGKEFSGIEYFVKGHLGAATRPILGFIDQIIEDPTRDDSSVIVQDWKSGTKAKKWSSKRKSDDGLAEQRQQIIYAELLRQEGVKVSGARLIFPVAKEVVEVDLGNKDLRNRVENDIAKADETLTTFIETNTFELKPSFLCAWCPLAKICPKAEIKPYDKMMTAYHSQPGPEILTQGIELL